MCGKGAQALQFPAVTYPRKRNLNRIEAAEQLVSYAVNFTVFLFTYQKSKKKLGGGGQTECIMGNSKIVNSASKRKSNYESGNKRKQQQQKK